MKAIKLSCTLATYNEEENIGRCLDSVRELADEIVIIDGGSTDRTVEIAKNYGARIEARENPKMFHVNKNKANDLAQGEWILQLDADEVVSEDLADEIREVVSENNKSQITNDKQVASSKLQNQNRRKELFERHQSLLEQRDGKVGTGEGEVVAFFVPRKNYFLGKVLTYGGSYPDGVIRLFKKDKARFPEKSLHEQ
jgi:glycosyltransferase involved in cell wall biosynthesis